MVRTVNLEEGIFELIMADKENQNTLTARFCDEFAEAIAAVRADPSLKVLLLSGLPEVFCAGASLDSLEGIQRGEADAKDFVPSRELLDFPLPVVALMEGDATGGGLAMALCCDILLASENRRYGFNFTDLGFTPGLGTTRLLPMAAGHAFASEMMFTAKYHKGRELSGCGIFNRILPGAKIRQAGLDIARRIAEKPGHVLRMLKETLALPRKTAYQEAVSREHLMHAVCFENQETINRIRENYIGG